MKKVRNLDELHGIVYENWFELNKVADKYLNEAGLAAKEVYKIISRQLAFQEDIASLNSDEEFKELINISGKHPEYYRILKYVYKMIENSLE